MVKEDLIAERIANLTYPRSCAGSRTKSDDAPADEGDPREEEEQEMNGELAPRIGSSLYVCGISLMQYLRPTHHHVPREDLPVDLVASRSGWRRGLRQPERSRRSWASACAERRSGTTPSRTASSRETASRIRRIAAFVRGIQKAGRRRRRFLTIRRPDDRRSTCARSRPVGDRITHVIMLLDITREVEAERAPPRVGAALARAQRSKDRHLAGASRTTQPT